LESRVVKILLFAVKTLCKKISCYTVSLILIKARMIGLNRIKRDDCYLKRTRGTSSRIKNKYSLSGGVILNKLFICTQYLRENKKAFVVNKLRARIAH
jgi:hypothetical protein